VQEPPLADSPIVRPITSLRIAEVGPVCPEMQGALELRFWCLLCVHRLREPLQYAGPAHKRRNLEVVDDLFQWKIWLVFQRNSDDSGTVVLLQSLHQGSSFRRQMLVDGDGEIAALPPLSSVSIAIKLFEPGVHHLDDAFAAKGKAKCVICQQYGKQVAETPLGLALLRNNQCARLIEKSLPKLEGGRARGTVATTSVTKPSMQLTAVHLIRLSRVLRHMRRQPATAPTPTAVAVAARLQIAVDVARV